MLSCTPSQESAALRKGRKLFNCQFDKSNTLQILLNRRWGRSRQVNPKLLQLLNPLVLLALLNHRKTNWQMAIHKILCNLYRNNTVAPKWFFFLLMFVSYKWSIVYRAPLKSHSSLFIVTLFNARKSCGLSHLVLVRHFRGPLQLGNNKTPPCKKVTPLKDPRMPWAGFELDATTCTGKRSEVTPWWKMCSLNLT